MSRRRIVVAHVGPPSSFIRQDLALLRERFDVTPVRVDGAATLPPALGALRGADALVCWFGSLRFLPLVLAARAVRVPVAIIAGGYDLANLPEIAYGNMRPGPARPAARALFALADATICVSHAAAGEARASGAVRPERLHVVHHGFDAARLGSGLRAEEKEALVLTVAGGDASTLRRKGLLTVARTARLMPEVPFVLAGRCTPEAAARLTAEGGPNLTLAGYVTEQELDRLYRRARVYYQPSLHEAFGCTVAEAMLYDCTPVVTARFALPEVVGDAGMYVEAEAPEAAVPLLRQAVGGAGAAANPRARVVREFPLERRRAGLETLVLSLIERGS